MLIIAGALNRANTVHIFGEVSKVFLLLNHQNDINIIYSTILHFQSYFDAIFYKFSEKIKVVIYLNPLVH